MRVVKDTERWICSPAAVEPVKEIAFTAGGHGNRRTNNASATGNEVQNTCRDTRGNEGFRETNPLNGASDEGLNTTVFPVTRAGAIFRAGIETGKFHGVITDTTPSGSRCEYTSMSASSFGKVSPENDSPSIA